ncbi:hypothetical protein BDR07DRAFT_1363618 [Suillus spraguei]|nr:hypothetical protein BDR07DRAFT_1363618 [Suillus spraguei]
MIIKDRTSPLFDHVPAQRLELWQVDMPINETTDRNLSSLTLDTRLALSHVAKMLKIFDNAPQCEHLHIVIQGPTMSCGSLHLKLNCIVLGDNPCHIIVANIAQTRTVCDLREAIKEAIKDKREPEFNHVAADCLELWQVKIFSDDPYLLDLIRDEGVKLHTFTKLSDVFADGVEHKYIHVVVRHPAARHIPAVDRRFAYLKQGAGTPSAGAKPSAFSIKQGEQEYLCNRPPGAAHPVPVTLLHYIFAKFVDDCQNHRPTASDNDFVWQLSEKMSAFYPDDLTRMNEFRKVLHDYGIELNASMVGSKKCMTEGHLLSPNGKFVQVIVEGKNEIGGSDCEPFTQAMLYYRKFIESRIEIVRLRSVMPCIHIIVFGACIGFAGSVFTEKVQSDVLVPVIPLFWHSTDLRMQAMAARTFGALKIAINELTKLYSQSIPSLEPKDPPLRCPYPRSHTNSTGHSQKFSYDQTQILREKLIFFGETVSDVAGNKICIKFTRHYSPEAHEFCASQGHAPKLIAYNHLAGGWNVVIMNALDIDNSWFLRRPGSYRLLSQIAVLDRQPLKEAITSLIEGLHEAGYVHGDLCDTNFVVGDHKQFMLLDFDWAGPIQNTYYPMLVNRRDIRRPDGALDGQKIVPQHDLDMLDYLFNSEQNGQEPAAKRRRISGEGSSTVIS